MTDLPQIAPPLTITPWAPEAVAAVRPHLSGGEWKDWDAPYFPPPTEEEADRFAECLAADPWQRDLTSGLPTCLALCAERRTIGIISWHWEDEAAGWRRVGLVLYGAPTWGRGLGRRYLRAWTEWLLAQPDTHRVDLATWSGNERMMRCAAACGYAEEARLVGGRLVRGQRYDAIVMGQVRR